jgi:cellobiose dehydrogenase (acceptor)
MKLTWTVASSALAQDKYTDTKTGIEFWRQVVDSQQTAGGFEWGYALPGEPTGSNDEYIGYIVSKKKCSDARSLL